MTILDAYALIAGLRDEPARADVEALLADETDPARIAATNLAEVYDRLLRLAGMSRVQVDGRVDQLARQRALTVLMFEDQLARRAGELRAGSYHRTRRPVSHADCVAAAMAESMQDRIATSDPHLASLAREIGIEVLALPDSTGKRP